MPEFISTTSEHTSALAVFPSVNIRISLIHSQQTFELSEFTFPFLSNAFRQRPCLISHLFIFPCIIPLFSLSLFLLFSLIGCLILSFFLHYSLPSSSSLASSIVLCFLCFPFSFLLYLPSCFLLLFLFVSFVIFFCSPSSSFPF